LHVGERTVLMSVTSFDQVPGREQLFLFKVAQCKAEDYVI